MLPTFAASISIYLRRGLMLRMQSYAIPFGIFNNRHIPLFIRDNGLLLDRFTSTAFYLIQHFLQIRISANIN